MGDTFPHSYQPPLKTRRGRENLCLRRPKAPSSLLFSSFLGKSDHLHFSPSAIYLPSLRSSFSQSHLTQSRTTTMLCSTPSYCSSQRTHKLFLREMGRERGGGRSFLLSPTTSSFLLACMHSGPSRGNFVRRRPRKEKGGGWRGDSVRAE